MAEHAHTPSARRPATPPGTGGRRSLAAGIAALALVAPALASTGLHTAKANPDADLIATCAQHLVNIAAVNADDSPARLDDGHALWHAYDDTYAAIRKSEPQTMAGVIAKARAARAEANAPAGEEDESDWSALVVRDLLRVVDGAL